MLMAMADIPFKIRPLLDYYRITEQGLQGLIAPITQSFCLECGGTCCQEAICRESIESPFLNALIQKQDIAYNYVNGWLTNAGCRLSYGRPQVCYAYFCNDVLKAAPDGFRNVEAVTKAFAASGNRALGSTHLIGVQNLDELSYYNISKIMNKMSQILQMISRVKPTTSEPPSGTT